MHRIRSWARTQAHGGSSRSPALPADDLPVAAPPATETTTTTTNTPTAKKGEKDVGREDSHGNSTLVAEGSKDGPASSKSNTENASDPAGQASEPEGSGPVVEDEKAKPPKPNIAIRFLLTTKQILLHSWVNVLLVFVPVGIAVANVPGMPAGAVFAINAVAIIPLAGLLSHATESVARKLGDTIGALLNVTFGNAVELIIFIALVKNEIRIVQASLLGSILANLLLILGMCFFLGGLRYREQIYNSTVTQMSACLLSLSVISLVLPTAFHASFKETAEADIQSLKISRGTSVILLLVYIVYLLFQLKSHAYMYESTPQHIIDEESAPGPAAGWLDSSSSSESSSDDDDSDSSSHSKDTVSKRVKRAFRGARRRKSSAASVETVDGMPTRTPSFGTNGASPNETRSDSSPNMLPRMHTQGSEEAVEDEISHRYGKRRHKSKRKHRKHRKNAATRSNEEVGASQPYRDNVASPSARNLDHNDVSNGEPRRVDFADTTHADDDNNNLEQTQSGARRNYTRAMSFRPVKNLVPTVFTQNDGANMPNLPAGPVPRVRYGIRRTNSLPDRLNQYQYRPPGAMMPSQIPTTILVGGNAEDGAEHDDLSRNSAIAMLLISTALVAVCAEFMVNAIDAVVSSSPVGEVFIGLIILPIVGNAAEHVTSVTVAMKNKMDLAIGVAVGSSIQIALFITPIVVILGWIMDRDMTLYFTLFETVCLFVSTFIVNFLVLDGRSNYLEGSLLCATYIIIAVVAYFYPPTDQASSVGA